VGTDLTPEIVAGYGRAFGQLVLEQGGRTVVLARDSRQSGPSLAAAVSDALQQEGVDVTDCGLIPTPTAQLAVEYHRAGGGIVVTASHNPIEWNALKFVGSDGLFLDRATAERLFALVDDLHIKSAGKGERGKGKGRLTADEGAIERHIQTVLGLSVVDVERIKARGFTVVLDCVRGVGGTIFPKLLDLLGCHVIGIDLEPDGAFPRSPEPIPANLTTLAERVQAEGADVGIAIDPDGDRLALVDGDGVAIGEDYTLAFAVRAVLERKKGPVVTNLSTSLVVDDAARDYGVEVLRAPVGEANVARAMQEASAVIGGEGNGGVMLPELHLGRDAPVAAALVLDYFAEAGASVAELVATHPRYVVDKAKLPRGDLATAYDDLEQHFSDATADRRDGLRLAWRDQWIHLRPSGTEPIVRLIVEAPDRRVVDELATAVRMIVERGTS